MANRTRTGLLEDFLARARDIEALARARRAAPEPMTADEERIVLNVLQHSVGLERAFERWIALRCQGESAA